MFARDMLAGAFSPVSWSTQRGQALLQPQQHSMQMHMREATLSSPLPTATLRDSHSSSNSVTERCSIIVIPIQQYVPTALDLTRADTN